MSFLMAKEFLQANKLLFFSNKPLKFESLFHSGNQFDRG